MMEVLKHPFKADYQVLIFEVWNPLQRTRQMGVDAFISLFLRPFFCAVKRRYPVTMSVTNTRVDQEILKNSHHMPAGHC